MTPVRVLIVEDSPTVRLLLQYALERDPRLLVVGAVSSAEAMLDQLERLKPDVISLDIRLPGMNGLDATLQVMRTRPTPIVVVAAGVSSEEGRLAMDALRAGALAVVEKPSAPTHGDYATLSRRLCDQLVRMSRVKVLRQSARREVEFGSNRSAAVQAGPPTADPPAAPAAEGRPEGYSVLGVVASTGGPNALVTLLNGLGREFPLPILLVQHIVGSFLHGFTEWLTATTPFDVRIAADGETPQAGCVYMAPLDRHLGMVGGRIRLADAPPLGGHRPSGTWLLRTLAADAGPRTLGVVLTGMGADGAQGLAEVRSAGGYTIVEDGSTAVVNGMPSACVRLGAVRAQLPLPLIAPHLRTLVAVQTEKSP